MSKLHELLAVEQGLAETANRISKETAKTLGAKKTIFAGLTKEHIVFSEEEQHKKQATEVVVVQSTVDEQLAFLSQEVARYWDCSLQKEEANQRGKADIIIDGVTLAKDVPSIVLLGLEKKANALLEIYNNIPTLDAAKSWSVDEGYAKKGVFKVTNATERFQTETSSKYVEISKATDRHQAQMVKEDETKVVGKYIVNEFSGAISSYEKASKLGRLTSLVRAIKTARQRANGVEVDNTLTIGAALFDYINNGN